MVGVMALKKVILIILAVVLVLTAAAAGGAYYVWDQNVYTAQMTLLGQQELTLEVGASYTDAGATAQVAGSILEKEAQSLPVTVTGTVDTAKVGTYVLSYNAQFTRNFILGDKQASCQSQRTVHVVDTQLPVIQLSYVEGSYTLPGSPYAEEGFTASDNYDGDLTAQVQRTEENGIVTYTVSDSSGNQTSVTREIFYDDPVAPELTLVGEGEIELVMGETYTEPGFNATDNGDGDMTEQVAVEGSVDPATLGDYVITYTVADGYGNIATAQRTVHVVRPPIPPGVGGVIYLTFDDGPSGYTGQLLDILDKYGVKATFFIVGYKDLSRVADIAARGHAIGNHSYSHNYGKLYASEEAFFAELNRCGDLLEAQIGYRPKLMRFPGGSSNSVSDTSMTQLTKAVEEAGYYYFDWNVDSKDAGGAQTAEEVFYNVCSRVALRKSSVVLQHDTKGFSVQAVEMIIQWALDNGYTFAKLSPDAPGAHHTPRS